MPFIGRKKPPFASYPFAPSAARVLELSVFSIGSFIQTSRARWALRERCLLFWNQNCTWRGVTPAGETLARVRVALSDGRRGIAGIHSRAQSPELCRGSACMLAPTRRTVMAQLAIDVSIPTRALICQGTQLSSKPPSGLCRRELVCAIYRLEHILHLLGNGPAMAAGRGVVLAHLRRLGLAHRRSTSRHSSRGHRSQ